MKPSTLKRTICASVLTLAVAIPVWGKGRPEPVSCPADVPLAVATACACNGTVQGDVPVPWKNHGQYVRCVVHYRNALRKSGCLTPEQKRSMARCAAQSVCGRSGAPLVCCVPTVGNCSDPLADGVPAGVCEHDPALACDVATDCTALTAAMVEDATACAVAGGTVEGAGAACSVCAAP